MSQYFPKPCEPFGGDINVKVDLSNYATKTGLKNISHVDASNFAMKANLAGLKTEVHKIDADRLKPVPDDLAKLSNVVKNDVTKKTAYDKLVSKVDNIDNTGLVLKTTYDTDKSGLKKKISGADKKIPDVSSLFTKTIFNAKVTKIENKIPSITSLATNLSFVENNIPDVSGLVKKTDFNAKITEVENKIPSITTLATNSALTAVENKIPDVSSLVAKTDFDAKLKAISDRVTKNKSKHLLVENELKKF